jgi:CheY-like chemotaxis protein
MTALRKVLVVDDDPVIAKSFDRVLSGKGYAVITAANGEEALRKLSAEDYDVVYTDIKMPGMNGLEVAEKVKARKPWTPVVIITGYGTAEQAEKAKAAGVTSFLHKPLSPEMIEGSAREVLEAATAPEAADQAPAAIEVGAAATAGGVVKNIALFFAAPFIGLAYIVALPFVGFGALAWFGLQAAARKYSAVRTAGRVLRVAGYVALAPFIALAWIIVFPVAGLVMLAWMGARSLVGQARL